MDGLFTIQIFFYFFYLALIKSNYKIICWRKVRLKDTFKMKNLYGMNNFKRFGQNVYWNLYTLQFIDFGSFSF